jgi:hypothetical protein
MRGKKHQLHKNQHLGELLERNGLLSLDLELDKLSLIQL